MGAKRTRRWEQKGGMKTKEKRRRGGSWWCFGVSLKHCATSSSTATSSLRLLHFPTIICHLQFPLTFAPSVTLLFSVSPLQLAVKKDKEGGSEGWIKVPSLAWRNWKKQWRRAKWEAFFFLSCAKNAQGDACQMWGRPKEESQNNAQNAFFKW